MDAIASVERDFLGFDQLSSAVELLAFFLLAWLLSAQHVTQSHCKNDLGQW